MGRGKRQANCSKVPTPAGSPRTTKLPQSSPIRKLQLKKLYNDDPKSAMQIVATSLRSTLERLDQKYQAVDGIQKQALENCIKAIEDYAFNRYGTGSNIMELQSVLRVNLASVRATTEAGRLTDFSRIYLVWAINNLADVVEGVFDDLSGDQSKSADLDVLDISLQQTATAIGCAALAREYPQKRFQIGRSGQMEILNLTSENTVKVMRKEIRSQIELILDKLISLPLSVPFRPSKRRRISPLAAAKLIDQ